MRSRAGFFQITNPNATGSTKATGAEFALGSHCTAKGNPEGDERAKSAGVLNAVMWEKNMCDRESASTLADVEIRSLTALLMINHGFALNQADPDSKI